jgi:hypothetical protein
MLTPRPHVPAPGSVDGTSLSLTRRLIGSPRARLVAGAVLAIALGFIPADIAASLRERSAFHAIDERVVLVQAAVDSPASYDALDGFRAQQLDAKRSAHRMIVLTSLLIWAATAGGLAYVWFKRLPWDRLG